MSKEIDAALLADKLKRKEVAKRRTFWFLLIVDILLIVYFVVQILILTGAK